MHCGYVVKVDKLRPHPNADRLLLAEFFGNTTCVSANTVIGELGIYFPSDNQLSLEYCDANHLCRKDADGNPDTGYLERDKRNIKPIKLRGEKSDGIFMPLSSIAFTGANLDDYDIGDTITIVNGIEICGKYIPRGRNKTHGEDTPRTRKPKINIAPLFSEHKDTEQLAYNLSAFKPEDEIEITLKMHGTSGRTAFLPVAHPRKQNFIQKLFRKPIHYDYTYDYISGTRRTVCENFEGGFYGSNEFRQQHHNKFVGKLMKGETVYYEIVGFTHTGQPIMSNGTNKTVGEDFVKQYGDTTVFSYGCEPAGKKIMYGEDEEGVFSIEQETHQSDIYVYRMTMTNEDGFTVEYTPDFMRYRCEQMGVKCVPVLWKGTIPKYPASTEDDTIAAGEWIKTVAEQYYDGPDPIGKNHIREGVVVRIINRPTFTAFKHKNWSFRMLEGIIKDSADAPDMEEAEEIIKENNEDVEN